MKPLMQETTNQAGWTLEGYVAKVKSMLDEKYLFSPVHRGITDEQFKVFCDDVLWAWNDDVPILRYVDLTVMDIMAVNAVI